MSPKPAAKTQLERLRRLCLAFPGATEKIAWGAPTFRVRDKMFAMGGDEFRPRQRARQAI